MKVALRGIGYDSLSHSEKRAEHWEIGKKEKDDSVVSLKPGRMLKKVFQYRPNHTELDGMVRKYDFFTVHGGW